MKISERARQIASNEPLAREKGYYIVETDHVLVALDEWQEDVERRLAEVRHAAGFERSTQAVPIVDPGPNRHDDDLFRDANGQRHACIGTWNFGPRESCSICRERR